ncbi:hypothetical protein [Paraburkholderia tropica]|uniref:hypothetical protein n=1 Tax=Paraburkholderia tropica TaxID=92647 RepID=UPI002AB6B7D2|nr:hypothetical protein [Paraburkholderia tropica]
MAARFAAVSLRVRALLRGLLRALLRNGGCGYFADFANQRCLCASSDVMTDCIRTQSSLAPESRTALRKWTNGRRRIVAARANENRRQNRNKRRSHAHAGARRKSQSHATKKAADENRRLTGDVKNNRESTIESTRRTHHGDAKLRQT